MAAGRPGVDAVGVERFTPGHAWGSTHGGTRMFRVTCLEHPGLVPLARRSLELSHELERVSGDELFVPSGGLLVGPPDGMIVGGTLWAAREHGIGVARLDRARLGFPAHTGVPDDHIRVLEPSAGLVRPEASVRAAVRAARAAGAAVLTGCQVTRIVPVTAWRW